MCGRFTQCYSWDEVHRFLRLLDPVATPNLRARYNIAPTTLIDVVVNRGKGRELVQMRRGLIPGWWKKSAKETPPNSTRAARRRPVSPCIERRLGSGVASFRQRLL
jgi:putative SOS response-associated peptidase YedK